ncbi:hypothetical protein JCM3765_005293 [Sporobolomyces pararoseus]
MQGIDWDRAGESEGEDSGSVDGLRNEASSILSVNHQTSDSHKRQPSPCRSHQAGGDTLSHREYEHEVLSSRVRDERHASYPSFGSDHSPFQGPISASYFPTSQRYLGSNFHSSHITDCLPGPQANPTSFPMTRDFHSFPSSFPASYPSSSHFPFQSSPSYVPPSYTAPYNHYPLDEASIPQYRARYGNDPSPNAAGSPLRPEGPFSYYTDRLPLLTSLTSSTEPQLQHYEFQPAVDTSLFPLSDSYDPLPRHDFTSTFSHFPSPALDENRRYSWPLTSSFDDSTLDPLELPLPPSVLPSMSLQARPLVANHSFSWSTVERDKEEEEEEEEENELFGGARALTEIGSEIQCRGEIGSEVPWKQAMSGLRRGDGCDETGESQRGENELSSTGEKEGRDVDHSREMYSKMDQGGTEVGRDCIRRSERRVPQISQVPQVPQTDSSSFAPPPPRKRTKRTATTTQAFSSSEDWISDVNFWAPFQVTSSLIEHKGESIGFSTSITNPSSFYYDQELESWLTYRRNFLSFDASIIFNLPTDPSSLHTSTNTSPISRFESSLESFTYPRGSSIGLLQFDTSRSVAKAVPVQAQQFSPRLPKSNRNSVTTAVPLRCSTYSTTFARIQFSASTSNHPHAQSTSFDYYFANQVTLVAVHEDGTKTEIGSWGSAKLIVRGRSPGQFEKSRKKKETAAVASSRKRKEERKSSSLSK